jgi:enoyl-CoA hydratase
VEGIALLEVSRGEATAVVTLARPERHNALTVDGCHLLRETVETLVTQGVRAVVVTGSGKSFCSGADLDAVYTADFRAALYAALHAVVDAPVPVIAAVNGPAIGAGTQLAIAADLRVVAPAARFAVPTARIGLAVDPWTIRRLALLAGNGAARRLLLAGDELTGTAALACGLADREGTPDDALAWAEQIAELAPLSVAYSKRVLNEVFEAPLGGDTAQRLTEAFEGCWASSDFTEGRLARAERRRPRFTGK